MIWGNFESAVKVVIDYDSVFLLNGFARKRPFAAVEGASERVGADVVKVLFSVGPFVAVGSASERDFEKVGVSFRWTNRLADYLFGHCFFIS
ncbi:hypothetical protein HMPREF1981_00571 [Bacteroides pyogenes F0041]|uniref:Uncharacterized protein n=1 Tax=Bacteroides pyogenes F0041 TaxID=1321819 RepID=U2CUY9_9BACE|nr:hypothetical protein HMPREF1981_00571 [Bacteroides pyogenes F0041]GAE23757.1 hypothetical protein JCM10003_3577 [Bacteroides pyogenes JCM 10003]